MKGLDIPFLTKDHPDIISVFNPTPSEVPFDIRKGLILYLKNK